MPNLRMITALAALVATTVSTCTFAQDWPTRPVTMVVTFAAGSGDDVLARILRPRAGKQG